MKLQICLAKLKIFDISLLHYSHKHHFLHKHTLASSKQGCNTDIMFNTDDKSFISKTEGNEQQKSRGWKEMQEIHILPDRYWCPSVIIDGLACGCGQNTTATTAEFSDRVSILKEHVEELIPKVLLLSCKENQKISLEKSCSFLYIGRYELLCVWHPLRLHSQRAEYSKYVYIRPHGGRVIGLCECRGQLGRWAVRTFFVICYLKTYGGPFIMICKSRSICPAKQSMEV